MLSVLTESLSVPSPAGSIGAIVSRPETPGPYPVIVVLHEIFGINPHIQSILRRLAAEGYVAIAPALFDRFEPGFAVGYDPDAVTIGRRYKAQTQADDLLADIQATIDVGRQQANAQAGPVGCIGFCFGGHVAYLAATLPDVAATAAFYGAGVTDWLPGHEPGSGPATIDRLGQIRGKLWGFFGLRDASIPPTAIDQIEQTLMNQAKDYRLFRYVDADHGFFCDARASYHAESAIDAWQQVKELFAPLQAAGLG